MLRPQDLLVTLKIFVLSSEIEGEAFGNSDEQGDSPRADWSYRSLGRELDISVSEISAAIQRSELSGLVIRLPGTNRPAASLPAVREFVIHGARYVYPAEKGEPVRGIATAHAAPVFRAEIAAGDALVPVWPYPKGGDYGFSVSPLYRSVPFAAARDEALYDLLALIDVLRLGRARERKIAAQMLKTRLQ